VVPIHFVFEDERIAHASKFVNEIQILFEDLAIFFEEQARKNPTVRTMQATPKNSFLKMGRIAPELFANTLAKSLRPVPALFDCLRHLQTTHAIVHHRYNNTEIVTNLSPDYITEVEPVTVTIHPSRFPECTLAAYVRSFRTRQMDHRFHYESEKQAQQWLALHEAYSPARTDDDCLRTYERAFSEFGGLIKTQEFALISFGCGGGQKDLTLLKSVAVAAKKLYYVPSDVSVPLVVTAHLRAISELQLDSKPVVIDLGSSTVSLTDFDSFIPPSAKRVIAFFGMLPNFESDEALKLLSHVLRADNSLLISANLAPGGDYLDGVTKILPLYDNELTRRWLATSLTDVGVELSPNDIEFTIVPVGDLLRIEANYRFRKPQRIRIEKEEFNYAAGEQFRLFFSYRHTSDRLRNLLAAYGIDVRHQWITASSEEGVFLCVKNR
jgi:L-histidine N-alpha-methyltransferase